MGGNYFNLGRLPRQEYIVLEQEIRSYLDIEIGDAYLVPRYYANKPDFGDLDVLVSSAAGESWQAVRDKLIVDLGITESKQNGPVFCAVYRNFQVDLIVCPPESLLSTYHYMSFNDVGNLLGKIFRRLGLKYGNNGLTYVFRRPSNENFTHEIPISRSIDDILSFVGVDAARWHDGFDDLDDVFAWVVASPYFSVEPYTDPKRAMRSRLRKRPTVEKFLRYLEANNITKTFAYKDNPSEYLPTISQHFPDARLMEAIDEQLAAEKRANALTAKFSGKLVMKWLPQLEGKSLGEFIQAFKKSFEDFDGAIANMKAHEVEQTAKTFFREGFGARNGKG